MLVHAAERDDFPLFEYLVEHGTTLPSKVGGSSDANAIAAMHQRRHDWTLLAVELAFEWHLPLTAIRVIHEYFAGFNWSVVYQALASGKQRNLEQQESSVGIWRDVLARRHFHQGCVVA